MFKLESSGVVQLNLDKKDNTVWYQGLLTSTDPFHVATHSGPQFS